MTKNSYICNFINENQYDWKEKLEKFPYYLKINEFDGLYSFNYNLLACEILEPETEDKEAVVARTNFNLPITQEARGIIINPETKEVVCWPFRKFGNYGESYVDNIDWKSASVQEKIDGSIMKLYYDNREHKKEWILATNRIIDAKRIKNHEYVDFYEIFKEAAIKQNLDLNKLDKNKTYIFELVSPQLQIVIKYPESKIYHLGTRSNITGQEFDDDIGIEKPKRYKLSSLDECILAADELNKTNNESSINVQHEGFVVCDKNYNRIKIKSKDYFLLHKMANNGILSIKDAIDLVAENNTEEFLTYFPQHKKMLDIIQNKYIAILQEVNLYNEYCYKLWNYVGHDSKKLAEIIKKDQYCYFGFAFVNHNQDFTDTFKKLTNNTKKRLLDSERNFYVLNKSYNEYMPKIMKGEAAYEK